MKKSFFLYGSVFLAAAVFASCSKTNSDLPTAVSASATTVHVHPSAWMVDSSSAFHGKIVAQNSYDLSTCAVCHGKNLQGGTSGISCYVCHTMYPHDTSYATLHRTALRTAGYPLQLCQQCHGSSYTGGAVGAVSCETSGCHQDVNGTAKSPEACNTCHGAFTALATDTVSWAPPKSPDDQISPSVISIGAHRVHLTSSLNDLGAAVACKECHTVPSSVFDAGHLTATTIVAWNGVLASLTTKNGSVVPSPSFQATTGTCTNTYCHGYFYGGNKTNAPVWNKVDGTQAACGSCHGNPATGNPLPPTHANYAASYRNYCQYCHLAGSLPVATCTVSGSDTTWSITDKSHHINGKISHQDGTENALSSVSH